MYFFFSNILEVNDKLNASVLLFKKEEPNTIAAVSKKHL
jgi:hypothetical protein